MSTKISCFPQRFEPLECPCGNTSHTRPLRHCCRAAAMQLRCPHCNTPVEIPDGESISSIECPSCGNSYGLISEESTRSRTEESLKTVGHFQLLELVGV